MKTVAIEDLVVSTILTFCENAAELGCPKDKEVDMWFRELSYEEQNKVADKMLEIEERNLKMQKDEAVEAAEPITDQEVPNEKVIKMVEIELDIEEEVVEAILELARSQIVNDKQALINYGVNKALEQIVETDGKCLKKEEEEPEDLKIPKDIEECIQFLNFMLCDEDIQLIKDCEEKDMCQFHHTIGQWIRNSWGLWADSELKGYFGVMGLFHADDMSSIILDSYHRHLHGKPLDVEAQVDGYKKYWKSEHQSNS